MYSEKVRITKKNLANKKVSFVQHFFVVSSPSLPLKIASFTTTENRKLIHKKKQKTMSNRATLPDLNKYLDKSLSVTLNGNRGVKGTLRGFDHYCNIVLDNTVEMGKQELNLGMVVIRGNTIVNMELVG